MGTIRKQSILGAIYTYLGVFIGFITTGIVTPRILSPGQIGMLSVIVAYATIFATVANLGMSNVITRFFPYFNEKSRYNNGFLLISLSIPFIGFLVSVIMFLLIKPFLIQRTVENIELLETYILYVIPFIFSILYFTILDSYYKMLHNVILGSFFKEVIQRIIILIGLVLFNYTIFQFSDFVLLYLLAFLIPVIALFAAIMSKISFSFKSLFIHIEKNLKINMIDVGLFGILGTFAGVVTINIDRIMVERLAGLSNTGIYTIAFFFGSLVVLPSRSLMKISSAFISEAWKSKDEEKLQIIFHKSTITQLIIGLLLLVGIWGNIHNILKILPPEYEAGKYVILFIGLAYLSDMFVGVSLSILATSKHYRYQTYVMMLQIILIVGTNFIFIPIYGIVGAAIASCLSKILINIIRIIVIKVKLNLYPYTLNHIYILLLATITYIINLFLPVLDNFILDIIYRSIIIVVLFCLPVYLLKLSEDINEFVLDLWKRFLK